MRGRKGKSINYTEHQQQLSIGVLYLSGILVGAWWTMVGGSSVFSELVLPLNSFNYLFPISTPVDILNIVCVTNELGRLLLPRQSNNNFPLEWCRNAIK